MQRMSKYLLSFVKRDWDLKDYPVEVRHFDMQMDTPTDAQIRPVQWMVRIPNWLRMTGYGDTLQEAQIDLERKFHEYKSEGNTLPRPGTKVPIQFAPMEEVAKYQHIAEDFFPKIVQMPYQDVLITDSSSLWHFPVEEEDVRARILEDYGVDVLEIEDANLVQIFRRIQGM